MLWSLASVKWWVPSLMRLSHSGDVSDVGGRRLTRSLRPATPRTWFKQEQTPVDSTPKGPGKPGSHSNVCELSRVQYVPSCLPLTYSSNLKLLTILSNFRFHEVHLECELFFLRIHLKNEYIKIPSSPGMLSNFHMTWSLHLLTCLFTKAWLLLMSCNGRTRLYHLSTELTLFPG